MLRKKTMKYNRRVLFIIMLVMLSSSVFASVTWNVPTSAQPNTNFNIQISASAGSDSGGYKILKPTSCTFVDGGTLGTDGYVRQTMAGTGTTSETFKCSSSATFTGEYTIGAGWTSLPSKTVTIQSTTTTLAGGTTTTTTTLAGTVESCANFWNKPPECTGIHDWVLWGGGALLVVLLLGGSGRRR